MDYAPCIIRILVFMLLRSGRYAQHPIMHPRPSTLNPESSILDSQSSILKPQTVTRNPQPSTFNPQPSTLITQHSILHPTLNHQHFTLNPQSSTLNPKSDTLNTGWATLPLQELRRASLWGAHPARSIYFTGMASIVQFLTSDGTFWRAFVLE